MSTDDSSAKGEATLSQEKQREEISCKLASRKILQYCVAVQQERVHRQLTLEHELQRPLRNLGREIQVLVNLCAMLSAFGGDERPISPHEEHVSPEAAKEIRQLDPRDTELLREAGERLLLLMKRRVSYEQKVKTIVEPEPAREEQAD